MVWSISYRECRHLSLPTQARLLSDTYAHAQLATGIVLLIFLAGGCITYEEEMHLASNGSGRARIHYVLSKDMAKLLDTVAQRIAADPRLKGQGDVGPLFSEAGVRKVFGGKKGLTLEDVREAFFLQL